MIWASFLDGEKGQFHRVVQSSDDADTKFLDFFVAGIFVFVALLAYRF